MPHPTDPDFDPTERSKKIDWSKPIQHANGEPCELIEIWPSGTPNFPDKTHIIRRTGPDVLTVHSLIWWMNEDGVSGWPAFSIVNVPGEHPSKEPVYRYPKEELAKKTLPETPQKIVTPNR